VPYIVTRTGQRIPDFGASPTVTAIKSGVWSDPTVWSRAPVAGDVVKIPAGISVQYDVSSAVPLKTVAIEGSLWFKQTMTTLLTVQNLFVPAGGSLDITVPNPANKAQIRFADLPLDLANDPEQFGNGLIVLGKCTMLGAVVNPTFVRSFDEPLAGETDLMLESVVNGWNPNDSLILPDTRQLKASEQGAGFIGQWERPKMTAVSLKPPQPNTATAGPITPSGDFITLAMPLTFNHKGSRDGNGVLDCLPHVGNLSRNITLHPDNHQGLRGHVWFGDRADVNIRYVQFHSLGRTTNADFDDTTYAADGSVSHVGTNQRGRYSIHFDHLIGPATPPANGHQFTFVGNSVWCSMDPQLYRWGININDSHYGLVQHNVVYNWAGSGINVQSGSESHNVLDHNFVVRVNGTGNRQDAGRDGAGFWIKSPLTSLTNNVACNVTSQYEYSYGFTLYFVYVEWKRIPNAPGADPILAGQFTNVDMNAQKITAFSNNEAYGALRNGLTYWWVGCYGTMHRANAVPSTLSNFKAWGFYQWGLFAYESCNMTLDGFVMRGDGSNSAPEGLKFNDYYSEGLTIKNADIQGMAVGFTPSHFNSPWGVMTPGTNTIRDSFLRNIVNVQVGLPWTSGYTASIIPPRITKIDRVTFAALPGRSLVAINMRYPHPEDMGQAMNLVISDQVFVTDYNGVVGDSFQVYYAEQAPTFIVPQTVISAWDPAHSPRLIGCPVAGLTNQQAWTQYGCAIAGAVVPSATRLRPGINGLVI